MQNTLATTKDKKNKKKNNTPMDEPTSSPESEKKEEQVRPFRLTRVIIHALKKNSSTRMFDLEDSKRLSDIDDNAINLVKALEDSYSKSNIMYTVFDGETDSKLPGEFDGYSKVRNGNAFIQFSKITAGQLCNYLSSTSSTVDKYLVFTDYESDFHHYVSVFMIQDAKGLLFIKNVARSTFDIVDLVYVDLENLIMAFRLDMDGYLTKQDKFLSVISKRDEVSNYFINWIGADKTTTNTAYTNIFFGLINFVDLSKIKIDMQKDRNTLCEKIFDEYKSSSDKVINLIDLGRNIFHDENYLTNLAKDNDVKINTEFSPDRSIIRQLVRLEVESKGITLRFPRADLKDAVIRLNGKKVIIDSPEFAQAFEKVIRDDAIGSN